MNNEICIFCEEGEVISRVNLMKSEYRGHTAEVPLYYNECMYCGSEYAGLVEMKKSKEALLDWRGTVDVITHILKGINNT